MKIIKSLKNSSILVVICFSTSSFAYNAGHVESSCKKPRFDSVVPDKRKKGDPVPEVGAESEIEFTVSGYADPTTIVAMAKKERLKLDIVDKNSFYRVTSMLPAVLNGKYARIDLKAKMQGGDCIGKGGWLLNINKATEAEVEVKEAVEEAVAPVPAEAESTKTP
jgi:hypothetical protein